ncbi:hypothetical protein T11_11602, partial [Trichinella zimbabwensis]
LGTGRTLQCTLANFSAASISEWCSNCHINPQCKTNNRTSPLPVCLYPPTGHWQNTAMHVLKLPYQPTVEYEQADVSTANLPFHFSIIS